MAVLPYQLCALVEGSAHTRKKKTFVFRTAQISGFQLFSYRISGFSRHPYGALQDRRACRIAAHTSFEWKCKDRSIFIPITQRYLSFHPTWCGERVRRSSSRQRNRQRRALSTRRAKLGFCWSRRRLCWRWRGRSWWKRWSPGGG